MDKNKKGQSFAGYFATAFTDRLQREEGFGIGNAFKTIKESGKEAIAETAADMAITETKAVVAQIKEDSATIIAQTAEKLSPDAGDSWNIIREQVAPQGGFFRTIFARLLWIGAKVTSFIGATAVDQWTGRNEKEQNRGNIDTIFGWLLGWMFKKPTPENQTRVSPLNNRSTGIPKSWLANSPIPTN